MENMSTTTIIITCMLSSSLAATIVASIKELILWTLNRKAKLADDATENEQTQIGEAEKLDKILTKHQQAIDKLTTSVDNLDKKLNVIAESYKIILKDKIHYLVFKYIEYGEITLSEKHAIQHMWNMYHFELGGNGDLDDEMQLLDEIPVKEMMVG